MHGRGARGEGGGVKINHTYNTNYGSLVSVVITNADRNSLGLAIAILDCRRNLLL